MSEQHDPLLQTLFADARQEIQDEEFTSDVLSRTHSLKYRTAAGWFGIALLLAVVAWIFAAPLQGVALLVVQGLSITLIDVGSGWLAWLVAPINNIGSLLVLVAKLARMIWKKLSSASYTN
jgi:hypothetical protein